MPNEKWERFKSAFRKRKKVNEEPRVVELPPRLQVAVHEQLVTTHQLRDRMGQRPKGDRLGGLWKRSPRYKAVETALKEVNDLVEGGSPRALAGDQEEREALRGKLTDLVQKAEAYLTGHGGNKKAQQDKAEAMRALKQRAELAIAVLEDPDSGTLPDEVTLSQAIQMKRCGVLFKDVDFVGYPDDEIDPEASDLAFGSGNANTVSKLVYGEGEEARALIFKPEPEVDRNPLLAQKTLGIDLDAPHYGERNIASREIDKLLGGDTVVESRMVLHDGQLGLLMDKAGGRMPGERAKEPAPENALGYIRTVLEGNPRDKAVKLLKSMEFVEVDTGDGPTWMRILPKYADPFKGVPPTPELKADIQKQLCGLEWADALSGQFDRHGENYLLDFDRGTGKAKVTGIDNDLAFGSKTPGIPAPGPDPLTGYNGIGLPVLVDRATFQRIDALRFDRDVLPKLEGRLKPEEIEATRSRFTTLQEHARKLDTDGCVVDDWLTWRKDDLDATAFLTTQPNVNSYYARDIHEHTVPKPPKED